MVARFRVEGLQSRLDVELACNMQTRGSPSNLYFQMYLHVEEVPRLG